MCNICDPEKYYGQDDEKQQKARKKDAEKLRRVRAAMAAKAVSKN